MISLNNKEIIMRLLSLFLCLCTFCPLITAEESPAPADPEVYWQTQDWQDAGQAKQVGDQVTLLHKSNQGYRLGLALLLPDWQEVAELLPLSRTLNNQGFDTLIMLPSPSQLTYDPYDKKDQDGIQLFREEWQKRLTELQQNSGSDGYQLVVAAGSSAAWYVALLGKQAIADPDALVLVDAYYPDTDANNILAHSLALAAYPVLDLYRKNQVSWLDKAAQTRRLENKRNNKLDCRQIALDQASERGYQLNGWLHYLGWK
jgi:hypothetical protein